MNSRAVKEIDSINERANKEHRKYTPTEKQRIRQLMGTQGSSLFTRFVNWLNK